VLNVRQPLVAAIWNGLGALLEPAYRPLRRVLPATRGVDFAPLAVLLILSALGIVVRNNLY
jgi:YggT family protein